VTDSSDETGRLPITAAVLAGGRSERMGIDKTLLDFDGRPLVVHVVEAVGDMCASTLVVTNRPDAAASAGLPPEVRIVQDEVAYQGPLGGLVTALSHAREEWVLALAADMPWLQPRIVQALWARREGADVVIPVSAKGPEPLLALYRKEACLPAARAALASGRRRLVAILPGLRVAEVDVEELRGIDPQLSSLQNINTAYDLAEARSGASFGPSVGDAPERACVRVVEVGTRRARGMPSERPVTIYMNDVEVATVQATPKDLEEMAAGFLLAEGLIQDRDALAGIDVDAKRGLVYLSTAEEVPDDMVYKTRYVTSGCGKGVTFSSVGHARNLAKIDSAACVSSEELYGLMGRMAHEAAAYRDTGGMHACALGVGGRVRYVREDVGRHNALDKLLGRAWLDRVEVADAVLLTTGRISYEMAVKAAKSRVPIVVSRTAVTDLAAEIAIELGITLVGYARGGKLVVYTHPHRISAEKNAQTESERGRALGEEEGVRP